jgi:hypothetical protein
MITAPTLVRVTSHGVTTESSENNEIIGVEPIDSLEAIRLHSRNEL